MSPWVERLEGVRRCPVEVAFVGASGHDLAKKMPFQIVAREEDLASVHAFVGEVQAGAVLVLEGEAGIGKSTLWLAGVERARSRGLRILVSRPAEAERGLAYVGLGDLFDHVFDEVLPALSPPRRRALEVALLREEASGDSVDHRALAVAVHDALELLGRRTPTLVAVDDVQWFDASSSSALGFTLRRLVSGRVLVLLTRRIVDGGQPSEIERALDGERVERLRVGPLSVGTIHRLVLDRLGRPFPRQTLLRIHERSGGNPFFALELAWVVDKGVDPLEPLPVPETLDELPRRCRNLGRAEVLIDISNNPAAARTSALPRRQARCRTPAWGRA